MTSLPASQVSHPQLPQHPVPAVRWFGAVRGWLTSPADQWHPRSNKRTS
jgi:hypothetical protein